MDFLFNPTHLFFHIYSVTCIQYQSSLIDLRWQLCRQKEALLVPKGTAELSLQVEVSRVRLTLPSYVKLIIMTLAPLARRSTKGPLDVEEYVHNRMTFSLALISQLPGQRDPIISTTPICQSQC